MTASDPHPKKRVAVLDTEMSYVDVGEGEPIVFLHGNPTTRKCIAPSFHLPTSKSCSSASEFVSGYFENMCRRMDTHWFGVLSARAGDAPDVELPAAERAILIEAIAAKLDAEYVFPEVAKEMGDAIRTRAARGLYISVAGGELLAEKLTADL